VKIYGYVFHATIEGTLQLSWDRVVSGLEATLHCEKGSHLPTLLARRQAIALSHLWYFAQLLHVPALHVRVAAGKFL
jgi:hypothetical protein